MAGKLKNVVPVDAADIAALEAALKDPPLSPTFVNDLLGKYKKEQVDYGYSAVAQDLLLWLRRFEEKK